jgi:hypothetical protein
MRVAKDANVRLFLVQKDPSLLRQLPAFVQNMTDRDAAACQFNHSLRRKNAEFTSIDVAGNCCDWRDLFQLLDDRPLANVPGVKNVIDVSEVSPDGWIEQAMGIGNHSDQNDSALVHGAAAGWESVRVILRCEAQRAVGRCKAAGTKKPEAYSLQYVEDFLGPRTTQMPADRLPQ